MRPEEVPDELVEAAARAIHEAAVRAITKITTRRGGTP